MPVQPLLFGEHEPGGVALLRGEGRVAAAAAIIRSDTALLRQLRRRVSDLKTRIDQLTTGNMDILEGLRAVAREMP